MFFPNYQLTKESLGPKTDNICIVFIRLRWLRQRLAEAEKEITHNPVQLLILVIMYDHSPRMKINKSLRISCDERVPGQIFVRKWKCFYPMKN